MEEQSLAENEQTPKDKPTTRRSRRRFVLIFTGFVLLGGLGVFGFLTLRLLFPPATQDLHSSNSGIAFTSNRDGGQWGIYLLEADGSIRRLTPLDDVATPETCTQETQGEGRCRFDYFPSFSFDGRMINFLTNRGGSEMEPGQVRPDGSDFQVLDILSAIASVAAEERFDWDPAWAVNGGLGWSKISQLNLEIYLRPAGDVGEFRITSDGINGPRDWFMAWSPDGQVATFSSDRAGNENIYRVDVADLLDGEGFEVMQLTDNPVDDFHPSWTLDGEQILFLSDVDDGLLYGEVQLFLMDPDGRNQRPVGDAVVQADPVYSADGTQMVYISNESGTWSLYQMDLASGEITRLTDDSGDDLFPVWGPVLAAEAD